MFGRYAVFYAPASGEFADFGARWLGWDTALGAAVPHPLGNGLDVAALTAVPRKYGFHATLKPPFRLAEGRTVWELQDALEALAAMLAPVRLDGLHMADPGGFVALVPDGDAGALDRLAGAVMMDLDRFRGPQTAAEMARRQAAGLTPRQTQNLARWGYPYVLDDFRFHMTLTGPVTLTLRAAVIAALEPIVTPVVPRPCVIEALTLLGQDAAGMFHQIQRYPLSG